MWVGVGVDVDIVVKGTFFGVDFSYSVDGLDNRFLLDCPWRRCDDVVDLILELF